MRETPSAAGGPMEAGAAPVAELPRAGDDGSELVTAPCEAADALQRVGGELLLRRQLALVRLVVAPEAAAAHDEPSGAREANRSDREERAQPGQRQPAIDD